MSIVDDAAYAVTGPNNGANVTRLPSDAAGIAVQATFDLDAFAPNGLFDDVALATNDLAAEETRLLALRDAGDWPAFFRLAVQSRRNVLISSATASGKTTFATGLVRLIPDGERLLTIEDARELTVPHPQRGPQVVEDLAPVGRPEAVHQQPPLHEAKRHRAVVATMAWRGQHRPPPHRCRRHRWGAWAGALRNASSPQSEQC